MRYLKLSLALLFGLAVVLPFAFTSSVEGQAASEAPGTDLDQHTEDLYNNIIYPGEPDNFVHFKEAMEEFSAVEDVDGGIGPVFNAQSCRECHQNGDVGGPSQVREFRAGHLNGTTFVDAPGGSLINQRATAPEIVERVSTADPIHAPRISLNTLGDGFVECIADQTLRNNVAAQPAAVRGTLINVPLIEDGTATRVGRFGWKDQHGSLLSFSADAYLNEMGITTNFPATRAENTSNGNSVAAFDFVADPEDTDNTDVKLFADFMRGTRVPRTGSGSGSAANGTLIFDRIGCNQCHTRTFVTSPAGTVINGGTFTVPAALGSKIIHPFSDFALHDVGTGDGIVQNGGQGTRNQMRTPPLWAVRIRNELMHDGESKTLNDAILRHAGQATTIRNAYNALSSGEKADLINFLRTL